LEEGMATYSSILAWRIPTDRGAWWATGHGVTKSQTQLSNLARAHTHTHTHPVITKSSSIANLGLEKKGAEMEGCLGMSIPVYEPSS